MGKARFCKGKRKDSILSLSQDRVHICKWVHFTVSKGLGLVLFFLLLYCFVLFFSFNHLTFKYVFHIYLHHCSEGMSSDLNPSTVIQDLSIGFTQGHSYTERWRSYVVILRCGCYVRTYIISNNSWQITKGRTRAMSYFPTKRNPPCYLRSWLVFGLLQ